MKLVQNKEKGSMRWLGKNHVVVMPDAKLDLAVNEMMASFFGCAGKRCLAEEVAVPVSDNYLPLKDNFVEAALKLKVGYGLDESVQMGPLVSKKAARKGNQIY